MANLLTFGVLFLSILVIDCDGSEEDMEEYDMEDIDFYNHEGPVPIPGKKGLLNFILLVPRAKKEAFCKGLLNSIDGNRPVDVDYGFGYGPGIELHESASDSYVSFFSMEKSDVIKVPDIPDTQLVYAGNGWKIAQSTHGDGKNAHGRQRVFPVSLERYCRMFLVTYF